MDADPFAGDCYQQLERDDTAPPEECPDCGFDAVVTWIVYTLSEVGVTRRGWRVRLCIRCTDQGHGRPLT